MARTKKGLQGVGGNIRKARVAAAMTQEELANRTKFSRGHVSSIESGKYPPSLSFLQAVSEVLSIPVSELVKTPLAMGDVVLAEDEVNLLGNYRELNLQNRGTLSNVAAALLARQTSESSSGIVQNNFGSIHNSANSTISQSIF